MNKNAIYTKPTKTHNPSRLCNNIFLGIFFFFLLLLFVAYVCWNDVDCGREPLRFVQTALSIYRCSNIARARIICGGVGYGWMSGVRCVAIK